MEEIERVLSIKSCSAQKERCKDMPLPLGEELVIARPKLFLSGVNENRKGYYVPLLLIHSIFLHFSLYSSSSIIFISDSSLFIQRRSCLPNGKRTFGTWKKAPLILLVKCKIKRDGVEDLGWGHDFSIFEICWHISLSLFEEESDPTHYTHSCVLRNKTLTTTDLVSLSSFGRWPSLAQDRQLHPPTFAIRAAAGAECGAGEGNYWGRKREKKKIDHVDVSLTHMTVGVEVYPTPRRLLLFLSPSTLWLLPSYWSRHKKKRRREEGTITLTRGGLLLLQQSITMKPLEIWK